MNVTIRSPDKVIDDIMVCTEKMQERQDLSFFKELHAQIPYLIDNLPERNPRLEFLKTRLREIKGEIPLDALTFGHFHACLVNKVRRVANQTFKVLHPKFQLNTFLILGLDHQSVVREQMLKPKKPLQSKEPFMKSLEEKTFNTVLDFCKNGSLRELAPTEAEQLWDWAAYQYFEPEILSLLMETFWVDPGRIQIAIDEALIQAKFEAIAESVVVYHFHRLSGDHQEKVASWVKDKEEKRSRDLQYDISKHLQVIKDFPMMKRGPGKRGFLEDENIFLRQVVEYIRDLLKQEGFKLEETPEPIGASLDRMKTSLHQILKLFEGLPQDFLSQHKKFATTKVHCEVLVNAFMTIKTATDDFMVDSNLIPIVDALEKYLKKHNIPFQTCQDRGKRIDRFFAAIPQDFWNAHPEVVAAQALWQGFKEDHEDCSGIVELLGGDEWLDLAKDLCDRTEKDEIQTVESCLKSEQAGALDEILDEMPLASLPPALRERMMVWAEKYGDMNVLRALIRNYLLSPEALQGLVSRCIGRDSISKIEDAIDGNQLKALEEGSQEKIRSLRGKKESVDEKNEEPEKPWDSTKAEIIRLLRLKEYDRARKLMTTPSFKNFDVLAYIEIQDLLTGSGQGDLIGLVATQLNVALGN